MSDTDIEWTDTTWNPTSGCDRVSPGCDHCYALGMAKRLKAMGQPGYQRDGDPRTSGPGFGLTVHPDRLNLPLRWRKPRKVFVNSMSDLFHKDVPDEYIARVWQTMGAAPWHTYQVLTKRHARMRSFLGRWYSGDVPEPYEVRDIPGWPGYKITTTGIVLGQRADTAEGLAPDYGRQGHARVRLYREGSRRGGDAVLVHRLVLSTFSRKPGPSEQGMHLNGDPRDNRLSNLRWGSQSDNWRDRADQGNARSYQKLSADDVTQIRSRSNDGESAYSIAKDYPVSDTQIRNVVTGRHWPTRNTTRYEPGQRAILDCVWVGVSVEDQHWADIRIPALLATPAAIRWISAEPLLGPVDLSKWLNVNQTRVCGCGGSIDGAPGWVGCSDHCMDPEPSGLDWVVAGGESGTGARPMHPAWARQLRDQCVEAGVPFLFKQHGAWAPAPWHGEQGASHAFTGGNYVKEGRLVEHFMEIGHTPTSGERDSEAPAGAQGMRLVGKKAAGRLLDGVQHDGYPEVAGA